MINDDFTDFAEDEDEVLPPIVLEIGEEKILSQVQQEYKLCWEFLRPKLQEWLLRLTVYNNQKREKDKVGDPLLFSAFQTVFATLYNDTMSVKFLPREEGDVDREENLTGLAKFDFDEMHKDQIDFEWDWDAMFFGAGMLYFNEFDTKIKCPKPTIIDPCTLLRDPRAVAPNGDASGFNPLRFWGREIALTKWELYKNRNYFNVDNLKRGRELTALLSKAKESRRRAQGLAEVTADQEDGIGDNEQFDLLEWYTHLKGKKYLITLGNSKTEIVRVTKMPDKWPLIKRNIFPISHDWDGVSIPDLIEDKQRARAVLMNLGLEGAKKDIRPQIAVADERIVNRADFNGTFIRVNGQTADGAVAPIIKQGLTQKVQWIMELLDNASQRALATPEIQQGVSGTDARTLGELEIMTAKVDTRNSLAVKIFGWSEREFWGQWYHIYDRDFKSGIFEKITRVIGPWGPKFNVLKREDFIYDTDPDIYIESYQLAESKRIMERNAYTMFLGVVAQDPTFNKRWAFKKYAELNKMSRDAIKIMFPPTLDEMESEAENEMIEKKKKPVVEMKQDHQTHLINHAKMPEGKIRDAHMNAHRYAMMIQRENEVLMQGMAQAVPGMAPTQSNQPNVKANISMPNESNNPIQAGRQTTPVPEAYQPK